MKLNIFKGNSLELEKQNILKIKKFDIVIGNPPYCNSFEKIGDSSPVYNLFIEYYLQKCQIISFVVPSRFFMGGKGLDKFRNMFINRNDIYLIQHFDDSQKIFGKSVDISGGVNYFIIDKKQNFLFSLFNEQQYKLNKYDIIITKIQFFSIIDFVKQNESLDKICFGINYFDIETNDKKTQKQKENENFVRCFVNKNRNYIQYIDKKYIENKQNFWKVLTTEANRNENSGFGNTFISSDQEVSSQTYIIFKVENKEQAIFLVSYLKTKFCNFILSLRKISQHISKKTIKWIPLPPLNQIWTDQKVYEHFKIPLEMQKQIEETEINGFKPVPKELSEEQLFELYSKQPQQIIKDIKKN